MGSPLVLTLVYTKLFLTTPVPGTTASLTQCVSSCYASPSCASFFYNYDDSVCYHTYFLYSLDKYAEMLSTSAADIKYFEWTPGKFCAFVYILNNIHLGFLGRIVTVT